MSNIYDLIGKRISILRKKQGLSQLKFSSKAGLSRAYMGKVELGKEQISFASLEKIINALEISIEEFFAFSDKRIELKDDSSLASIIDILSTRTSKEQKYILNLIEGLFEFKDRIR